MKKVLTLILALMMVTLAACGQQTSPAASDATAQDALYVDEYELNGTRIKDYYEGGKDGTLVRSEFVMEDGTTGAEYYDAEGKLTHMTYTMPDGTTGEDILYPDGSLSKSIVHYPDGGYAEWHFADNGYYDEELQVYYAGTQIYSIEVAADGTVLFESSVEYEEDGSYWQTFDQDDGSVFKTLYSPEGTLLKEIIEDPANDWYCENIYYPSGQIQKYTSESRSTGDLHMTEYYENGINQRVTYTGSDGTSYEDRYTEEGLLIYSYIQTLEVTYEYIADETGELVTFIKDGQVHEGNQIPDYERESFQLMQEAALNQEG